MELLDEKVYCSKCKRRTNHKYILKHEEGSDTYEETQWHSKWCIVQCLGCDQLAFVLQYGDEDSWDYDERTGERVWKDFYKVYPEEPKKPSKEEKYMLKYQHVPKTFKHVDDEVSELYDQIIGVYNLGYSVLCAAGLRTLIEAICSKASIIGGRLYNEKKEVKLNRKGNEIFSQSLEGKIFGLYESQIILWEHCRILQEIRDIGNNAVHEIKAPNIFILKRAISVIEMVLEIIYELKMQTLLKK